jgi:glycine cleavage system H protein
MPVVNGCPLPDDLLYDVENQLWYRERPDGLVHAGMTAVAVAMVGGRIVAITPKRAGRRVETGQACAVIESGKFVGPAKVCSAPRSSRATRRCSIDRVSPTPTLTALLGLSY